MLDGDIEAVSGGANTRVARWGKWQITWKLEVGLPVGQHGTSGCRGVTRQPFGSELSVERSAVTPADSVPRLGKRISIERNGRLVNVDNAPTNVPGLQGHRICEIENAASGRGGLPIAGSGVGDLAVDQEAAGSTLLNHQTFRLVCPVADRRGRGLRPGELVAHHAQQHARKSQAKCTRSDGPANAFHFLAISSIALNKACTAGGRVLLM